MDGSQIGNSISRNNPEMITWKTISTTLLSALFFMSPIYKTDGQIRQKRSIVQIGIPEQKTAQFPIRRYDTVKIAFIGDVMQHKTQIKRALEKGKDPILQSSYNYSSTFKYLHEKINRADIAVANMEFPVGDYPFGDYPAFKAPVAIVQEARNCGIDLFLLANNHINDYGEKGLMKTLHIYDTLGVQYTGVYKSAKEYRESSPVIINKKGIGIAFINFCYGLNNKTKGKAFVSIMDSTTIKEEIMQARKKGADIIVATPHWGIEYKLFPSAEQKNWAEFLFKNGVDIIVGTHPHVPQIWEIRKNRNRLGATEKIVFYSLGNFISNQSTPDITQLGLLAEIPVIKNSITGEIFIGMPEHTFLWCFKAGEVEDNFTVVPVKTIIDKKNLVKDKSQYERMIKAYNYVNLQFESKIK